MIKIVVLNDDRCLNKNLYSSHGLSLYLECDNHKYLFDVGQDDNFIKNSNILNIDLQSIDSIILSHGHYDHSEGLKYLSERYNLICHPDCFIWRKSKRTEKYNGFPFNYEEAHNKFKILKTSSPYFIDERIMFLGQIERKNSFECVKFPSILKDGTDDIVLDDTGIAIKTDNGLIIISGCGHSGICNTIEYAKKLTNEDNILAVIGGFHLKEIDNQTIQTVNYFKQNSVKNIYLGHCTSDIVCEYFKEELMNQSNVAMLSVGMELLF